MKRRGGRPCQSKIKNRKSKIQPRRRRGDLTVSPCTATLRVRRWAASNLHARPGVKVVCPNPGEPQLSLTLPVITEPSLFEEYEKKEKCGVFGIWGDAQAAHI